MIVSSLHRRQRSSLLFAVNNDVLFHPCSFQCLLDANVSTSSSRYPRRRRTLMCLCSEERETGSYLAAARRVCVALHHTQVSRLSSSEFVIMREREEKKRKRTGRIPSSRRHHHSSIFSFSLSFFLRSRLLFGFAASSIRLLSEKTRSNDRERERDKCSSPHSAR